MFKDLWNEALGPLDDFGTLGDRYVAWILLIIFTMAALLCAWILLGLFLYYPGVFFIVIFVWAGIIAPPIIAHVRHNRAN